MNVRYLRTPDGRCVIFACLKWTSNLAPVPERSLWELDTADQHGTSIFGVRRGFRTGRQQIAYIARWN